MSGNLRRQRGMPMEAPVAGADGQMNSPWAQWLPSEFKKTHEAAVEEAVEKAVKLALEQVPKPDPAPLVGDYLVTRREDTSRQDGTYLRAEGATVSREQYPELFALVGTTHGAGDGSTTFRLPNIPPTATQRWLIRVKP